MIKTFESYVKSEERKKRLGVSEIFHWTDYRGLMGIIRGNEMFSGRGYISFSATRKFNYMLQPIRITFDFNCMKKKFNFDVFDFSYTTIHEKEVRIKQRNIKDIKDCITNVEIFTTSYYLNYSDGIIEWVQKENPNINFKKMGDYWTYHDTLKESINNQEEIYYRGLHDGGEREFKMQTWTKDKRVAERYAKVDTGKILIAHLHFHNPLSFHNDTSQTNSTQLLKYFTEEEIRNILKDIRVRDYSKSLDGVEKDGIELIDKLEDIEIVVFDFIDHRYFDKLLRKHGYDAVIYLGWEGNESLEYRTFDENIELLDSIEV
jgi:hypothetical protein